MCVCLSHIFCPSPSPLSYLDSVSTDTPTSIPSCSPALERTDSVGLGSEEGEVEPGVIITQNLLTVLLRGLIYMEEWQDGALGDFHSKNPKKRMGTHSSSLSGTSLLGRRRSCFKWLHEYLPSHENALLAAHGQLSEATERSHEISRAKFCPVNLQMKITDQSHKYTRFTSTKGTDDIQMPLELSREHPFDDLPQKEEVRDWMGIQEQAIIP